MKKEIMAKLHRSVSASIRFFSFYLVNRTLCIPILGDLDYTEIFEEPGALEQVYAIFINVLEVDENGQVIDAATAQKRSAQYIREYFDKDYVVEPPFEQWELDLH